MDNVKMALELEIRAKETPQTKQLCDALRHTVERLLDALEHYKEDPNDIVYELNEIMAVLETPKNQGTFTAANFKRG